MSNLHLASLSDCQELYRQSGWNGQYWWYTYQSYPDGSGLYVVAGEHEAPFTTSTYPAYDVAFLLAHMPAVTLHKQGSDDYQATWQDHADHVTREGHSRTNAANALCRLAVELFKAQILLA